MGPSMKRFAPLALFVAGLTIVCFLMPYFSAALPRVRIGGLDIAWSARRARPDRPAVVRSHFRGSIRAQRRASHRDGAGRDWSRAELNQALPADAKSAASARRILTE